MWLLPFDSDFDDDTPSLPAGLVPATMGLKVDNHSTKLMDKSINQAANMLEVKSVAANVTAQRSRSGMIFLLFHLYCIVLYRYCFIGGLNYLDVIKNEWWELSSDGEDIRPTSYVTRDSATVSETNNKNKEFQEGKAQLMLPAQWLLDSFDDEI